MYFATIEKGHVQLEGCMYMGKIQEYREKLQQVSPDDVIIKYIGKIDGHYFYLVDYTEYQGEIGPPQILEIDSKKTWLRYKSLQYRVLQPTGEPLPKIF